MLLHTPAYLLFLVVVASLYWGLPHFAWRKALLLIASYVFYAAFDVRFAAILAGLTLATFLLGGAMPRSPRPGLYAWLNVAINLGVLGAFKYANFFIGNAAALAKAFGSAATPPALQVLLPVGISFYTFQAISYTADIYRKKSSPASSLLDFALYMAFFPKLIAGPLVRPAHFMQQLANPAPRPRQDSASASLILLLVGLFKKVVIADSLASISSAAFRAAALPTALAFPTPLYWQGFYLYAFQIYADFSGYTDIARASAALLGFELPENFRQPYWSSTVAAFWNRWHMSLTQWFREFLFFPLTRALLTATGRRYPRAVQIAANVVTMTVIGFWHGAAWTFVVWGLWHGLLLSVERIAGPQPSRRWQTIVLAVVTFHLVGIGWVLFGADSFTTAARFLVGLVSFNQPIWASHFMLPVLWAGCLLFGTDLACRQMMLVAQNRRQGWRAVWVIAVLVVLMGVIVLRALNGADTRPFIYGQF